MSNEQRNIMESDIVSPVKPDTTAPVEPRKLDLKKELLDALAYLIDQKEQQDCENTKSVLERIESEIVVCKTFFDKCKREIAARLAANPKANVSDLETIAASREIEINTLVNQHAELSPTSKCKRQVQTFDMVELKKRILIDCFFALINQAFLSGAKKVWVFSGENIFKEDTLVASGWSPDKLMFTYSLLSNHEISHTGVSLKLGENTIDNVGLLPRELPGFDDTRWLYERVFKVLRQSPTEFV